MTKATNGSIAEARYESENERSQVSVRSAKTFTPSFRLIRDAIRRARSQNVRVLHLVLSPEQEKAVSKALLEFDGESDREPDRAPMLLRSTDQRMTRESTPVTPRPPDGPLNIAYSLATDTPSRSTPKQTLDSPAIGRPNRRRQWSQAVTKWLKNRSMRSKNEECRMQNGRRGREGKSESATESRD